MEKQGRYDPGKSVKGQKDRERKPEKAIRPPQPPPVPSKKDEKGGQE